MRYIQTVSGPISPDELGACMMHEHLLLDLSYRFVAPKDQTAREKGGQPISLENLSWVRYNMKACRDNFVLDDEAQSIREVQLFKAAGGGAIVDVTLDSLGRNPEGLQRISRATGIHVIMGSGVYEVGTHSADIEQLSAEEISDLWQKDFFEGVKGTGIKCGIIGEIGCSWPLHPQEAKTLKAAAITQQKTGQAITIHPGRHPLAPAEIVEILEAAGADLRRVVIDHIERTMFKDEDFLRFADLGAVIEFDLFGWETSYYPWALEGDFPSDNRRIDIIKMLMDKGFEKQVVVSHDICTKLQTTAYGGHGYAHILARAVAVMKKKGIDAPCIDMMTQHNPMRILSIQNGI